MGASYMSHHLCLYKICVTCSLVSEEEADQIFFFYLFFFDSHKYICNMLFLWSMCGVWQTWWSIFIFGTWMDKWYVSGILAPFCCLEKHRRDDFIFFSKKVFKICLCLIIRNETLKNGTDYILKFFVCNSSFGVNYPPHQNLLLQSIFPPLVRESIYRDMTCANLKFFPPLMILISKL